MKIILSILLTLFIVVDLYSQHCKTLDNALFFTSIKLGGKVNRELSDCSKNSKITYAYYTDYRLCYDSLDQVFRKKYADLFKFQSIHFSFSAFSTNKKGQISNVELYDFFEDIHGNDSIISRPPANFTKLFNKLVSLYGKPSKIEKSPDSDSLFIKDLGLHQLVVWECNNNQLQLRVNYGSRTKALNIIAIQISNTWIDTIEETESLQ
jgi:hypothetical protein